MRTLRRVAVVGLLVAGCGGDGRPATAPPLPSPLIDSPCSEYDVGADGTIDIVYQFTYDRAGFLTRYVGTPAETGDFAYDANHFLLHFVQNVGTDTEIDYEETYTRDRDGRVLTYQQRGADDESSSATYTYDAAGRVVTAMTTTSDGSSSITYTYEGNALNPVSGRAVYPSVTSSFRFTSSADERMLHVDIDDGEDGVVDRTSDVVYDGERRVIDTINRTGSMVTSRDVRVYNEDGHLVTRQFSDSESGPVDWEYYTQFDARGLQSERGVRSPSGQFSGSIYRETNKSLCARTRTTGPSPGPRSLRARPSVVELPHTFAAR